MPGYFELSLRPGVQLQWTEPATQDLDKIEEYVCKENSPAVAIDIVLGVIETEEMILPAHPRAGRMGRVTGTRELVIEGVPFYNSEGGAVPKNSSRAAPISLRTGAPERTTPTAVSDVCICPRADMCRTDTPAFDMASA